MRRVSVIIVAAGRGERFGGGKVFALLRGKRVLDWSLERFELHPRVDEIILVLNREDKKLNSFKKYSKIKVIIEGGERRQDSVVSGFRELDPGSSDIVLIHDGVRPLISEELITRVIEGVEERGAVCPVISVEDTIKRVEGEQIKETMRREELRRAQTPQGFLYPVLKRAIEKAEEQGFHGSDEASLVERLGERVSIIEGDPANIKITIPKDLKIAEALIGD